MNQGEPCEEHSDSCHAGVSGDLSGQRRRGQQSAAKTALSGSGSATFKTAQGITLSVCPFSVH